MCPAERDRKLVTDFGAHRLGLGEAQVVCVTGLATADDAGLLRHKLAMLGVTDASRFEGKETPCA